MAEIDGTATAGSVAEQCARLGVLLGLDGPAPEDVLVSAIEDREYAHNLLVSKDAPPLREFLLANPPRRAAAPAEERTTPALLGSAAKSFWAWTRSGFALVDDETYKRRFGTCLECPHLIDPPAKRVYKAIGANGRDGASKICELCGCVASKKARLPSESCPAPHDEAEGMNRWGEPLPLRAGALGVASLDPPIRG